MAKGLTFQRYTFKYNENFEQGVTRALTKPGFHQWHWAQNLERIQTDFAFQTNGFKYEGQYAKDKKHGKGKYTYPNGDIYNGQWKEGVRHGKGTYKYKDDGGM